MASLNTAQVPAGPFGETVRCVAALGLALTLAGSFGCDRDHLVAIDGPSEPDPGAATNATGGNDAGTFDAGVVQCGKVGSICGENVDCCSELCLGRTCASRPNCGKQGHHCTADGDCCSGVCVLPDGRCQTYAGCLVAGEACSSHADCCSAGCSDPGTGLKSCQALEGCRPTGEVCTRGGANGECCSEICVYDSVSMLSRCRIDTVESCLNVGEICDDTSRICCGQPAVASSDTTLCYLTGMGISRCLGDSPNECREDGSACKIANDCCSHYCLPRSDGLLACEATCATYGAPCRGSRDCCMGLSCSNGTCQTSGTFCRQLGQPCDSMDECCSGTCSMTSLSCVLESPTQQ